MRRGKTQENKPRCQKVIWVGEGDVLRKERLPWLFKTVFWWEFPDAPVIRTLDCHCCGLGLIPGQGTKIPQAVQQGQKKKENK